MSAPTSTGGRAYPPQVKPDGGGRPIGTLCYSEAYGWSRIVGSGWVTTRERQRVPMVKILHALGGGPTWEANAPLSTVRRPAMSAARVES